MELSSINVNKVYDECLAPAKSSRTISVDGIVVSHVFSLEALEAHKNDIVDMLSQLPAVFFKETGGGMSFLQGCSRADGHMWTGMHATVDQLFSLGIAAGYVKPCLPRDMWSILPGGMPYYVVDLLK